MTPKLTDSVAESDTSHSSSHSVEKNAYHEAASKHKEERKKGGFLRYLRPPHFVKKAEEQMLLVTAKDNLLRSLDSSDGDTTTPDFQAALTALANLYDASSFDARVKSRNAVGLKTKSTNLEGSWVTLSKPKFEGCLGTNRRHDYMYTLGQMSFGMFRPTQLVCSVQGTFNNIRTISKKEALTVEHVPKSLEGELRDGKTVTRSYDIVTAFSIEPYQLSMGATSPNMEVNKRIEGIMTTCGYVMPNPNNPSRLTIWFTGGALEVSCNEKSWKKVFGKNNLQSRRFKEKAQVMGAKLLMGAVTCDSMDETGKMYYHFTRPIGGHDTAYVDIMYLDETLRIVRTHKGSVYVFARIDGDANF